MSLLPSLPGVYSFLDEKDNVLYVGKAKNLKNRVRNYTQIKTLTPRIRKLVKTAVKLKFQILDSELEALLVEAELIHTYQPPFNIQLKDDKSPIYLLITDEQYPRLIKKRKREILKTDTKGKILGPFPSSYKLKEVLKIIRPIFPWCNKKINDNKACFYNHIDLCPGSCIGEITKKDYLKNIKQLELFLRGKKKTVTTKLKKQMTEFSNNQEFEKAGSIKHKLQLIKEVTSPKYRMKPNLILSGFSESKKENAILNLKKMILEFMQNIPSSFELDRIEGYDVSNIQGKDAAVSMVVFSKGNIDSSNYRIFNIKSIDTPNDYHMMKEALIRRQNHPEWGKPKLIVIDGGKGQLRAAISVWNWNNPIISIAKNPDRIIFPQFNILQNKDKLTYKIIKLPINHPTLNLIQKIRDESHRFAKKQHIHLRNKNLLK